MGSSLEFAPPLRRQALTERGYTIVRTLGNQENDLKGGYAEQSFKLHTPVT
jgi:hypothetical protein